MSKYPSEIDTNLELPSIVDGVSETSGETINALIKAVIALEKAIGTNPQGSASSLNVRLSEALNNDGTLKAAALASAGLVSLPIDNNDVGASAAIEESKLDLDVGTQSLQNQISLNDIDISSLQDSLAILINRVAQHVLGNAERHDGYQIDVLGGLPSAASISTVGEALDFLRTTFLNHVSATAAGEHNASAITYVPLANGLITSTNVQGAIEQIDGDWEADRKLHNDLAHSDGVSRDGYVYLNGQAGVGDASLRLTRYQSFSAADIMKVGLINAATVKSKNLQIPEISSSATSLDVVVDIGSESRTLTITNIHLGGANEAVYPSGTNKLSLKGLVDSFNDQFATNAFPVTAYESDDGEIVLQHNIARDDCTITINDAASTSALTALGFSDIDGTKVYRYDNYIFTVDGTPYSELKTISDGYLTQGSLSTTIDLGVDVTSSGLDLRANQLIHIYDHSAASGASGTYRIATVSAGTTITVHAALAAGSFNYIIYEDACDTAFAGSPRVVDLYIDSERNLVTSERAEITSSQMGGLASIVEISKNFPASVGSTLTLSSSGTTYSLVLTTGAVSGKTASFEEGFIGEVKVYAPDNVSYLTILMVDPIPVTPKIDTITFYANEFQDNRLLLGTTHVRAGSSVVEIPLDRRNVGLVGNDAIGTEFLRGVIERDISNLNLNGVIRGFNVTYFSTDVTITGGLAYIGGKAVYAERQTFDVTNVANSSGDWNLVLNKNGKFDLYKDTGTGYEVDELLRKDELVLIAQITMNSTPLPVDIVDARFFVNDIHSRLPLTVDNRELGAGAFYSLEGANLYSNSILNDVKPEITVLSDLTIINGITIQPGRKIVAQGDLTAQSSLILSTNATLEVFGDFTANSSVILNSGAKLIVHGDTTITQSLAPWALNNSQIYFNGDASLVSIRVTGSNVVIEGGNENPEITFDGTDDGINVTSGGDNLTISNLNLTMTTGATPYHVLTIEDADNVQVKDCVFTQSSATVSSVSRGGIEYVGTVDGLRVENCEFNELGAGIVAGSITDVLTNATIFNNEFNSTGMALSIGQMNNSSIINNRFLSGYGNIHFKGANDTCSNIDISSNIFSGSSDVTETTILKRDNDIRYVNFVGNVCENINSTSLIDVEGTGNKVDGNLFRGCTTSDYAFVIDSSESSVSNNIIENHTGQTLSIECSSIIGNVVIASSSVSGTVLNVRTDTSGEIAIVANNKFKITATADDAYFKGCNLIGNTISIGAIEIATDGDFIRVSDNVLQTTKTSGTEGINLSTNNDVITFTGNVIESANTTASLRMIDGRYVFTDNTFVNTAATNAIYVGDGSFTSVESYIISNNIVNNGTTNGIYIDANNAIITNNVTHGAVGVSGSDIVLDGDLHYVAHNMINGTSGSERIKIVGTPDNLFIGMNRGVSERRTYSGYGSHRTGTWSFGSEDVFQTTDSGAELFISLTNLPIGVELESVEVKAANNNGSSDVTALIYERDSSSISSSDISGGGTNLSAGVYTTTTVPVSGTVTIEEGKDYYVRIVTNNTLGSNLKVGQISAVIKF